ncbi:discoidin domain-containing protein [Deinococcus peraridilitoris]|uniref:F5/8 type C domain-containing protein n=1 Tax=Deinococcus peraridilitoris (strain DSM 19664 / LMG 22246 / CIP 109416 / KR-200) TaxID=937777 RepID=L0A6C1_DEIPD|nr:discoidin domain-containing protein [Deinococcus peraridilitoris]AFZ69433.1 F5/8 type C domain-containing protein [Deinococcus peraridilitoris DSM 19664]
MPTVNARASLRRLPLGLISFTLLLASCGNNPPSPSAQTQPAPTSIEPQALPADALRISSSTASSASSSSNTSVKSWDDNLGTWWSANGLGQWVRYDLGSAKTIDAVSLAWYRGDKRKATFDVELSKDGSSWTKVLSKVSSSGTTLNPQRHNVPDQAARYIRVTNHGNTENSAIAITEAIVHGTGGTLSAGKAYYVDCSAGSDSNNGTSSSSAWRSLGKANDSILNPGDRLLLKRGCSWTGPLKARWNGSSSSPVTISAYGSGDLPLIRNGSPGAVAISGTYQIIEHVRVTADQPAPYPLAIKCTSTPNGWKIGFSFMSGSHHNTLRHASASGLTAGVHLATGSARNKVLRNRLTDNKVMSSNTTDPNIDNSGAWGVLINGDHNEVAWNYFSGNSACSEKYTIEGASLEVYKASGNYFHHNTSINDTTFSEMGGKPDQRSENNVYAYNLFAPLNTPYKTGELLVVRGWNSEHWGANPGTKFYNNTAFNVNLGIACAYGCDKSILSARNNIIVMRADMTKFALESDADFDEGNNIYWRLGGGDPKVIRPGGIDPTSRITDPQLSDPMNRNFGLNAGSPAVDAGVYGPVQDLGITLDLDGKDNTVGTNPDLGAFERQ